MSILNQTNCSIAVGNTGVGDCAFDLASIVTGFLVPRSFRLTAAQMATKETALAALKAAASADNPLQRIYRLADFVGVTNNSETPVKQTLGYGAQVTVRDGMYNFNFQYVEGGLCLSNNLSQFNGANWTLLLVDENGVLAGAKMDDELAGIPLNEFYNNPMTLNDGTNRAGYSLDVSFNKNYLNQDIAHIDLGLGQLKGVTGLQNVEPVLVSTIVGGVFTSKFVIGCGNENLYDFVEPADLADVSNFTVTNVAGVAQTITSVADAPGFKGVTFTIASASPGYVATGPFVVKGSSITALVANDIVGYEIVAKTLANV